MYAMSAKDGGFAVSILGICHIMRPRVLRFVLILAILRGECVAPCGERNHKPKNDHLTCRSACLLKAKAQTKANAKAALR